MVQQESIKDKVQQDTCVKVATFDINYYNEDITSQ